MDEKMKKVEKETKSVPPKTKEKESMENKNGEKVESAPKLEKKVAPKKKDVAIANGHSLRISPKHAIAICKVIKGKSPEAAIKRLEDVVKEKRAIPMAGLEVAHQKGKGLAGAKFPRNACVAIIEVIKQAKANAVVNGVENPVIFIAKPNRAAAPFRRGGRKGKRTHVYIELRERSKSKGAKK